MRSNETSLEDEGEILIGGQVQEIWYQIQSTEKMTQLAQGVAIKGKREITWVL